MREIVHITKIIRKKLWMEKNHYLINWPSCSELVGNRAYKIHMARWSFDSFSLQLSDSSEKCPHPERANFTLILTRGGAEAINSGYLSA